MTKEEIQKHKEDIDKLDHREMARLYRFAPAGHVYFRSDHSLYEHFMSRVKSFGGMTPAISKAIGW